MGNPVRPLARDKEHKMSRLNPTLSFGLGKLAPRFPLSAPRDG